jgi:hypothetical protein
VYLSYFFPSSSSSLPTFHDDAAAALRPSHGGSFLSLFSVDRHAPPQHLCVSSFRQLNSAAVVPSSFSQHSFWCNFHTRNSLLVVLFLFHMFCLKFLNQLCSLRFRFSWLGFDISLFGRIVKKGFLKLIQEIQEIEGSKL